MKKRSEKYYNKINILLESQKIKNVEIISILKELEKYDDKRIIDFELIYRGLKKIFLKKGSKSKNILNFFKNIKNSIPKREHETYNVEPENDDFEFDIHEPSILSKKIYKKELFGLQVDLLKLQEWLMNNNKTVIIVFEGRDSAGKGSTIKKFTQNLNPKGYKVINLGIPTPEERVNWWERYRSQIEPGKIIMFDRSWYNRGLIEPVMGYGNENEYNDFMENVNSFEESLTQNGDYLIKLWFSIDKETQARRFEMRQKSPLKYWKYSQNDSKMQDLWDKFTIYKEKIFNQTATKNNPWVIIDSVDKKISGLNAMRYVLQNIPYENKNTDLVEKQYPESVIILDGN
jgi:polyphosphate kinase